MDDYEEKRRAFQVMDEMKEDFERYALEIVRARGRGIESDPQGKMSYEAVAALVLAAAAYSLAMKSGERAYLREVIDMRLRAI